MYTVKVRGRRRRERKVFEDGSVRHTILGGCVQ
jgi:hypothetical protein